MMLMPILITNLVMSDIKNMLGVDVDANGLMKVK